MDAQTVGEDNGRLLIFQKGTPVQAQKKPGKLPGKLFSAAAEALPFFVWLSRSPPTCPRGDGGPRLGGKSRREERLRHSGGAYGMRRRDRRATA
jgi:hypothetical protein